MAMSAAMSPMVTSTSDAARSRARSDISRSRPPLVATVGLAQRVPDQADGVDERRAEAVELLAQVADVGLDHVVAAVVVVLPHVIEDLRLGQHPSGVEHEVAQEVELG